MSALIDVRDFDGFKRSQHCTNESCYTFSHTAGWCGNIQPRFCGCPFDYSDDQHADFEAQILAAIRGLTKAVSS